MNHEEKNKAEPDSSIKTVCRTEISGRFLIAATTKRKAFGRDTATWTIGRKCSEKNTTST